ncbi:MAG TPA: hypothetical protein DCY13_10580 [Verrucomicrobiales bacterium]|nr:hypothetical protein [Verrucomicrobiales bacterium]
MAYPGGWRQFPRYNPGIEQRTNLVEVLIRKGANVELAVAELVSAGDEEAVQLVLNTAKLQQHR